MDMKALLTTAIDLYLGLKNQLESTPYNIDKKTSRFAASKKQIENLIYGDVFSIKFRECSRFNMA